MKKLRLIPVFTKQKHFLQFILFMKLFITFLLLNTFSLYAIDTYSQSTRVSMHFNKVKISEILNDIETKTDYLFFYNHKDIKSDTKVSINVENKPISAILDEIFQNTDVKYSMLNNHIVLFADNSADKNMKSQSSEQTSIRVTGTVRDTNGEPLVGANISIKDTTIGTITDIDGNYSINAPNEQSVLLFSMIGFISQEIKAGDRKKLSSVTLQEDLQLLDEVVVVGYGT
ncbi:MAG: carboxypeptidase-like regulatory domain-containing protein, partial [Bacteroides xylanisolvens]